MVSAPDEVVSYEVPRWGVGELVLRDGRPILHSSPTPNLLPQPRHLPARECDRDGSRVEQLVASLGRFFAGERIGWTADELGLDETLAEWGATSFQRDLVHALCAIPYGE